MFRSPLQPMWDLTIHPSKGAQCPRWHIDLGSGSDTICNNPDHPLAQYYPLWHTRPHGFAFDNRDDSRSPPHSLVKTLANAPATTVANAPAVIVANLSTASASAATAPPSRFSVPLVVMIDVTRGSRGRLSGSQSFGRGQVSTKFPATVQSSSSIPITTSTPVMSQVGPVDQQFIIVPNLNYVPPSATYRADPTTTKPVVGDSSSVPSKMSLHHRRSSSLGFDSMAYMFAPNPNACTQKFSDVIKSMYDHPWPTYTQIPTETRDRWFQKWVLRFIWDAKYNLMIKKIYDHRVAKRFQQMMTDRHCLKNVANRASPRSSKYTDGSATFMKSKSRLSKSLDRETKLAETFKYTYTLKANKERFADEQSTAHYVSLN
ncbi:hypothetical protein Ahy_B09g094695 [Arachis hypogaea]|uniref:Uncharacterized protein n=1 Tax=Arachis hypogaea TaxID=3818 RepID=A0A444XBZ4_ARAHY|nr:hypothetical protein Ahy_B09g094695 [Arachis hypogaea]